MVFHSYVRNIYRKVVLPTMAEFPFFILMILLIDFVTFYTIIRHPYALIDAKGYWIDYPRLSFLSLTILYSYILTLLVYYTKVKVLKSLLYLVAIVLVVINIFLYFSFNVFFSTNTLLLILETNKTEIKDFIFSYLFTISGFIALTVFIFFVLVCFFFEKWKNWIAYHFLYMKLNRKTLYSIILLTFLLMGVLSTRKVIELFRCQTLEQMDEWEENTANCADLLTNVFFCVWNIKLSGNVLPQAERCTAYVNKTNSHLLWVNDTVDLVLVIGESFIKSHSNIYGYSLQTTPRMSQELEAGRLFAYTNVISPYAYTSESLRNVLSTNSIGYGEKWYEYPFFPAIFKKAGYNVMFWDNQYDPLSIYSCDFTLNAYLHSPVVSSFSYNKVRPYISLHDGDLITDFGHFWNSCKLRKRNFVLFHLQGQHFDTKARYPHQKEFLRFTIDSIHRSESWMTNEKRQEIAHYDNCTLYNDSIIAQIISIFKNRPSVMIYFSDHGENVYDIGDCVGRRIESPQSYEIPFIVWCSNKYIEKYPEMVNIIRKSVDKPLMTDNLCHILMRVGGVKSTFYHEERDILSSRYKCPPRIISGKMNYDILTKNVSYKDK